MVPEEEMWLPDGSGGTLAPPRSEGMDKLCEEFLSARDAYGDAANDMKRLRQDIVALMDAEGHETYKVTHLGDVVRFTRVEETKVSIEKDKPLPG